MFTNKAKIIVIAVIVMIIVVLFGLWRMTAIKLDNTKDKLDQISAQLIILQQDNDNLIVYNKKKDAEIKKINKMYEEKLNSIPADLCGDNKPSKELLQYLRGDSDE